MGILEIGLIALASALGLTTAVLLGGDAIDDTEAKKKDGE